MARTRQPQGPARIDWSNPLARNLRFFVTCSGTPFEHVRGVQAIAANAATTAVGADGVALRCSPAGTKYWYVPYHSSYALTGACSVSSHVRTGAAPGTFSAIASMAAYNGATDTPFDSYLFISYFQAGRANAGGYRNFYLTVSTIAANTDYRVGWICSTSNVEDAPLLLCNGTSGTGILNTGSGSGAVTDSGSNLLIGTRGDNTTLLDGDSYYIAGWGADIGLEGLKEIHRNPWQLLAPQRRLWIQLGAAAGGTTTEATLSATVTASLLGSRAISVTRSAASATGAATTRAISTIKSATTTASSVLARAVAKIVSAAITTVATVTNQVTSGAQTFYRELTAAATAGALALRQSNLTRSATATASALTLRAVGALRVATQTATATQTSIKVKLKELAATGVAASAALTRAIATTRLASAVLSASATLRVGVYLSAAASAVATRLAAVAHTFSVATATATATVTTLKVKLKELVTGAVSTATTLTRQTLAQRVATLAGTATAQRAISSTLAATQPVTAIAVKAISKTLAVAASALATLVRQLLSGSFWSADRTYTIAAAPRTYTIAAAPRTYTIAAAPRIYTV